jgi:hypothetical protein
METLLRWGIGFFVSLIIGQFVTRKFVGWQDRYLGFHPQWIRENIDCNQRVIRPWLLGTLERLFFTLLVGFDVPAVSAGIMTWLLIKTVTNWTRINPTRRGFIGDREALVNLPQGAAQERDTLQQEAKLRIYAVKSLLGSLVSMLFALLGGLICKGAICINFIPKVLGD